MAKARIKYDPVSVGLDTLFMGGSVAAIVGLIRQAAEARRQAKEREKRDKAEISPDTVVLRIGAPKGGKAGLRKLSEDAASQPPSPAPKPKASAVVKPGLETKEIRPLSTVGPRDLAGRFSTITDPVSDRPEKSAGYLSGVTNDALSIVSGIGGLSLGYFLVSKLTQKLEQNRLKRQIAAAQTEYIDLLDKRNVKNAEAFSRLFQFDNDIVPEVSGEDGMDKSAGIPTDVANLVSGGFDTARKGGAVALASYILMAGGTAYVVKKYLESRYGKRSDDEESPDRQTRILIKPGSAGEPFEVEPEQMLATVGVLRDCISDSVPPGVKQAGYDYSFIDDIARMKGGSQWILDNYARMNGLSRPNSDDFHIPLSMRLKYGKTLSSIRSNPEKHRQQLQGYVMNMMRRDPRRWFELLGQRRNSDIVEMKADQQIANMHNAGGMLGAIAGIPVLGDMVKNIASWHAKSSGTGRKGMARETLNFLGVPKDKALAVLNGYDFSGSSGWSRRPEFRPVPAGSGEVKAASIAPAGMISMLANNRTITDYTNMDVLKAISDLKKQKRDKKPAGGAETVKVEFDETLDKLLSEEDKRKIIEHLSK